MTTWANLGRSLVITVVGIIALMAACNTESDHDYSMKDNSRGVDSRPAGDSRSVELEMPVIANDKSCPVIAVYTMAGNEESRSGEAAIILAVWGDGRILWSDDPVRGGAPYLLGRIEPLRICELLVRLEGKDIFEDPELNDLNYGPDADYTVIAIADQKRRLCMSSWHELFELNPKLVVTSRGVTSLDGRDRDQVLSKEPESYRNYRRTWKLIRTELAQLVPDQGDVQEQLDFTLEYR